MRLGIAIVFVAAAALGAPLSGQDAPPPVAPSVEALVAAALARSPALAAVRERQAAAAAREQPAAALPDPRLGGMLQDAGFPRYTVGQEEMSMATVEVSQGFPYPGKRQAARRVARAETVERTAEIAAAERQVALAVRMAWARLYAADRELALLQATRDLVRLLEATARARYETGGSSAEAVIQVQLAASRLEARIDVRRGERARDAAALARYLPAESFPRGEVGELPAVDPPPPPWRDAALAGAPEVAASKAAVAAAEERVAAARLALHPDFEAGAGVGLRGSLDPVVTLRLGVELPFWRREKQAPLLTAAEHELEAARRDLADREAAVAARAAELEADWERTARQLVLSREAILPQTKAALDAARSAYLAGRGDFAAVIADFNLWLDARAELVRQEAERYTTWAQLAALTGGAGDIGGGRPAAGGPS